MTAYLLIPLGEVHSALIVIVLVRALGGVYREQLIVGPQPVPLSITVGKDAGLQQLVVGGSQTCTSINSQPQRVLQHGLAGSMLQSIRSAQAYLKDVHSAHNQARQGSNLPGL